MNKDQKGMALIESLLIILILAIIGFGGYYVWHTQKQTDKTNTDTVKVSQSSTPPSSSQKYLTIKEWGVRAPYNGMLTLEYVIQDNGASPSLALFSSKQLESTASTCSAANLAAGTMQRYRSTDEIFLEDGTDSNQTAADFAKTSGSSGYGHVGNYYYFFNGPQAACGESQQSDDVQAQTVSAVRDLLPALQAIPQ